jgi:hypothetical protein
MLQPGMHLNYQGSTTMNTIHECQQLLTKLATEGFFGTISFQFKDGQVALIRREETILPSEAVRKSHGRTSHEPTER